jgi:hypothetical protein
MIFDLRFKLVGFQMKSLRRPSWWVVVKNEARERETGRRAQRLIVNPNSKNPSLW